MKDTARDLQVTVNLEQEMYDLCSQIEAMHLISLPRE